MQVRLGLPDQLKPEAARLYWQAFGGKLGRVMGPEDRAHAFLLRVIRADHCICAVSDDGALLGIAGFKSPFGSFAGGELSDMQVVYGRVGAAWRSNLLRLLQSDIDNDRFLIDGICVAREQRGQGIGSSLVAALMREGVARGYPAIRLEVIDTNIRARALYERFGFAPWRSETLGPLRHVFGFSRSVTMVRALP
ncbi:MAG: GNAT family N-acetyltransferase [Pseudotabrizicola sp.]|uniref:GNAT family N-acetyltransferase n=1 Tax=Pseudotabrizicola sp. TaxID=2939647 RepID=UPI00271D9530|nr:GNAT family N-acetyltransferase [Pseudotabrizicola sp.]MDO8881483.1 GNAT family N-acetyltransferase [Pseudotabrizicola sp.]MDP2082198.1 GNAT family N-acetyltransferase [Pseudotabrizicola sp.]MDZ7573237.1 GNAT family N-acetyltransferase [Pseudotabrizicola sp.]